jgi:tRNA G18 (ribose-2'-O)-methylase SpoU
VPWTHTPSILTTIQSLQQEGYRVLAVEQTRHATPLQEVVIGPDERIALVLGNELVGVSEEAVVACDGCVVIPQSGSKHSLNVSVCAGVALWWLAGRNIVPVM